MRKKRFISWILTLCLLLGMFTVPSYAEGNTTTISGDGTSDQTGQMTITLEISAAQVTTAPTAKASLKYNGNAQALLRTAIWSMCWVRTAPPHLRRAGGQAFLPVQMQKITMCGIGQQIRTAAPSETFTTAKATESDTTDGKISGFEAEKAYQISSDNGTTWTDVTGKAELDVKAGTYLIHYAEDKNHEAGAPATEAPATEAPKETTEEETAELALNAGLKISQTGSKITVKWGRVKEADGYQVYAAYCGKKFGKPVATVKGGSKTKVTISKINGKTAAIKAKTVLVDAGKKQLSSAHAAEFRYASSNEKIATVDKKGKIKGVSAGTCTVYVFARNGYAKKIQVTLK